MHCLSVERVSLRSLVRPLGARDKMRKSGVWILRGPSGDFAGDNSNYGYRALASHDNFVRNFVGVASAAEFNTLVLGVYDILQHAWAIVSAGGFPYLAQCIA